MSRHLFVLSAVVHLTSIFSLSSGEHVGDQAVSHVLYLARVS